MIPSKAFDALVDSVVDRCTKKNVLVPRCIVSVDDGRAKLLVVSTSSKAVVLPQGLQIASFDEHASTTIAALTDARVPPPAPPHSGARLLEIIDKSLRSEERLNLAHVLSRYSAVFNFTGTQTTLSIPEFRTHHVIYTISGAPIRPISYRASPSEREVISDKGGEMF